MKISQCVKGKGVIPTMLFPYFLVYFPFLSFAFFQPMRWTSAIQDKIHDNQQDQTGKSNFSEKKQNIESTPPLNFPQTQIVNPKT